MNEGAAILEPLRYEEGQAQCLEAYAALATVSDEPTSAAVLFGAADLIRSRLGLPMWPVTRAVLDEYAARVRNGSSPRPSTPHGGPGSGWKAFRRYARGQATSAPTTR